MESQNLEIPRAKEAIESHCVVTGGIPLAQTIRKAPRRRERQKQQRTRESNSEK
jgi:hypothetical protein